MAGVPDAKAPLAADDGRYDDTAHRNTALKAPDAKLADGDAEKADNSYVEPPTARGPGLSLDSPFLCRQEQAII